MNILIEGARYFCNCIALWRKLYIPERARFPEDHPLESVDVTLTETQARQCSVPARGFLYKWKAQTESTMTVVTVHIDITAYISIVHIHVCQYGHVYEQSKHSPTLHEHLRALPRFSAENSRALLEDPM